MPPSGRRNETADILTPPEPVPDLASPVGFAQLDPMTPEPVSSPQLETPARTTPPSKPVNETAAGAKPSAAGSPAPANPTPPKIPTSSSPASFDKPALRKLFREFVGTIGNAANLRLTTAEARDAGVWVADDDDKKDIGDPLGKLVGRRVHFNIENVDDAEDFIDLVCALGAYVYTNVNRLITIARERRKNKLAMHMRVVDTENGATS